MHLFNSDSNILFNNTVEGNDKYGIYWESCFDSVIYGNNLKNNGLGGIFAITDQEGKYIDFFFIASIIFLIGLGGFIAYKSKNYLSRKKSKNINIKIFNIK